jgi:hypothetical protein
MNRKARRNKAGLFTFIHVQKDNVYVVFFLLLVRCLTFYA